MRAKIIHLIQKTEQTIDHLKFMFSSMPTSEGFMDSLQEWMVRKYKIVPFVSYIRLRIRSHYLEHYLYMKKHTSYYQPTYWETNKFDIKRTIARMSRNGGIM